MSSVCRSSLRCVDAREPVRASYKHLYKWPESDVEFVRSMSDERRRGERGGDLLQSLNSFPDLEERRKRSSHPSVVDSYSCRQLYLRSYTFTKKETVPEKTRRCLRKVKETATVLPILSRSSDSSGSVNGGNCKRKKKKKKKKVEDDCASTRKMREMTYSALRSVFHRLLFCATTVDVVD